MANFEFLSVQAAAETIGVTEGRVRQLLMSGEMKGHKVNGRAWVIPSKEVRRFVEPSKIGRPRKSASA